MIVFTEHSVSRLVERSITKDQVIRTLTGPDFILPARAKRKIAIKKFQDRFLKVVFEKTESDIIVITNHWISKIKAGN